LALFLGTRWRRELLLLISGVMLAMVIYALVAPGYALLLALGL
jgi:hypothetical protein